MKKQALIVKIRIINLDENGALVPKKLSVLGSCPFSLYFFNAVGSGVVVGDIKVIFQEVRR